MTTAVIDISKRIPEEDKRKEKAERVKLMAAKMVLNAYEVMGLDEVDRGYLWLYNYINNSIRVFFEDQIGEMNVPVEIKTEAQERLKRYKERLQRSEGVKVNEAKTEKEAKAMIIRLNQEDDANNEPKMRKCRQHRQRKGQ